MSERLPRVFVSDKPGANRILPCCGRDVADQPYCATLGVIHLLKCKCGAVWECVEQDDEGLTFEARKTASCRGPVSCRVFWEEEP